MQVVVVCGSLLLLVAQLLVICTSASISSTSANANHQRCVIAGGAHSLHLSELQVLKDQRYVIIPNWISDVQTDSLQADALALDAHGFDCCVGSADGGAKLNRKVRKSRQVTFYPPPSNAHGCVATRAGLISIVQTLRLQLQGSDIMGLPFLEPFETELSYLVYPVGGHYIRHLDIPARDAGWKLQGRSSCAGGSFCGGRTRRVVSFILYLNRNWDSANGGALRIFEAHDTLPRGGIEPPEPPRAHVEDIVPEGGTLVLIMSGDVEHMVCETLAERECIVGWFNEYREERVPDLDTFGTRT